MLKVIADYNLIIDESISFDLVEQVNKAILVLQQSFDNMGMFIGLNKVESNQLFKEFVVKIINEAEMNGYFKVPDNYFTEAEILNPANPYNTELIRESFHDLKRRKLIDILEKVKIKKPK